MVARTRRDAAGRYLNPDPMVASAARARDFLRYLVTERAANQVARRLRSEALPPTAPGAGDALAASREGLHATWMGHASFVLRVNGRTILLDPVWSNRVGAFGVGPRRLTAPGVAWRELPKVDALVLSHNHYDHLDVPTLRRLPRDTPVFCPAGVGSLLARLGFTRVTEREWWESATFDGARFTLVPAQHFSRRGLTDEDRSLWGGWVVEADGFRVYFAGDTARMSRTFRDVGERFGGLDAALMPVGAYMPRWFMRNVHVDPAEAGDAFLETGARTLIPMHWGTFRLSDEPMDAGPRELAAWARSQGVDDSAFRTPALGETLNLDSSR